MLTQEDDVELHALATRGWSVSAIAGHTGRDRKTVRRYLAGEGGRQQPARRPRSIEPWVDYIHNGVGAVREALSLTTAGNAYRAQTPRKGQPYGSLEAASVATADHDERKQGAYD
jgi:hypothetical protein